MADAKWLASLVEEILTEIEHGVLLNKTHRAPQISVRMIERWRVEKDAALVAKKEA